MTAARAVAYEHVTLMLAQEKGDGVHRAFYSFSTEMNRQLVLPEAYDKKCYSSKGWLITIAQDCSVSLLHPFSRLQDELPNLKTFKDWDYSFTSNLENIYAIFIQKCALSKSAILDYTLMVIHGELGKLAYCKPGDKAWTTIETWHGRYFDVTYYNRKFYAVNCRGQIMECDIGGDKPTKARVVANLPLMRFEQLYVVESAGSLLVVTREGVQLRLVEEGSEDYTYGTSKFQVFEVNLSTKTCIEIKNLGERTLFLGHNSSFSIEASKLFGCKPNSTYFTDDYMESYRYMKGKDKDMDMGIYNMEDGKIEPHYRGKSYSHITPPIWVEPRF